MAAGKFNMKKASGGVASITVADGVGATNIVLPESGTVATTSNIVGFKNYIINGGFDVWQYPSYVAVDGYKLDRWVISGASNISLIVKGDLNNEAPSARGIYFTKNGAGSSWFSQRIETPRRLSGKTVTVTFWIYSKQTMDGSVYFDKYNPTDGFTGGITDEKTFNWTNGWNKVTHTTTIPTLNSNHNAVGSYLQLTIAATGTSAGAWLAAVQLEEGSIATPFEQRPYTLELSLCRRYYTKAGAGATGVEETASNVSFGIKFDTPMRTTPTIVVSPTLSWRIAGVDRSNISVSVDGGTTISDSGIWLYLIDNSNGSVAGRPIINRTATNFIIASAEL